MHEATSNFLLNFLSFNMLSSTILAYMLSHLSLIQDLFSIIVACVAHLLQHQVSVVAVAVARTAGSEPVTVGRFVQFNALTSAVF